jgi:hypothetical protein
MLPLQVPPHGIGMGRLCCLKRPLQLTAVAELVKKHLNLQNIRVALARHKHMGEIGFLVCM